jgi:hypothetical protein
VRPSHEVRAPRECAAKVIELLSKKCEDEGVGVGGLGIRGQLCPLDIFQIGHFVDLAIVVRCLSQCRTLGICHTHTGVNR